MIVHITEEEYEFLRNFRKEESGKRAVWTYANALADKLCETGLPLTVSEVQYDGWKHRVYFIGMDGVDEFTTGIMIEKTDLEKIERESKDYIAYFQENFSTLFRACTVLKQEGPVKVSSWRSL